MKYILLVITLFISTFSFAQDKGINFEHGTWKDAVTKAKKENKMIYVDFFTTWCGPCKFMSSKFFPDKKAGAKYNPLFVNFKIDAEKGEGIELAKKYNVTGYPTNLFIDSKTEKIVYKTIGSPTKIDGFLKNADVAILEKNDLMTIEQYRAKYKSKKYDEAFLKKLIEKNNRLGNLNDEYVDAYLSQYSSKMSDSSKFNFITSNYRTVSAKSKSFDFILSLKNKNIIEEEKLQSEIESIVSYSSEVAKRSNNEEDAIYAAELMKKYYQNGYDYSLHDIEDFYLKNNNLEKLALIYDDYGYYFNNITDKEIDNRNADTKKQFEKSIRSQLKMNGVEDSKIEELVSKNIEQQKSLFNNEGVKIANNLNSISWNIYEKMPSNKPLVTKSLVWIQRAMQLTEHDNSEWFAIADTYAHLLEISGNKKDAIAVTKQVIEKATLIKMEGIDSFEKYLKELEK